MPGEAYSVEIDEYEGLVDGDKGIDQIASEEAFKAAIDTQKAWRDNLDRGRGAIGTHPRAYRNTGEAIGSITVEPKREGEELYIVGSSKVQVAVAEDGRVPTPGSPPPFDAISDWARERGLNPDEGQTWMEMVNAIRWSIAEEGLPPFGPGRLAAHEVGSKYSERVETRIENLIDEQE